MKKFFALLFGLVVVILMMGGCLNLEEIFPFLNKAPIIISEPITTATEDQPYLYQVEASDPNDDILTYYFTVKPEGMNINIESGLISWAPTNNQVGINQVMVEISDGKLSTVQSFEIEVINVNNSPQILSYSPTNIEIKINEGNSLKFEIQAQDIDLNTTLSYQWLLNGKKVASSIVSGNGSKSSWIYSAGYGDYSQKIVKVLVSDGELQDYLQWNITINDTTPPAQPTLNSVISPTNISSQILSGNKETNSSIIINGAEVISLNSSTDWSYSYNLSEGTNNISITSRDSVGNESSSVITTIILDTDAPEAPTLEDVVSPTNISTQTLSGTKETNASIWINYLEVVPINLNNTWTYDLNLFEGENNISITSRDNVGNESSAVTTIIEYDLNIYVNVGNTSGIEDGTRTYPFNTITEGIDAVAPGKSVIVFEGNYNEQLIINKSITLQGASRGNTFIIGSGLTGNLITITADDVTISGFKIDGGSSTSVGIYFDTYSSININNNIIQNNISYGINYKNSCPTIEYNDIKDNDYSGIDIAAGGAGIIRENSLIDNKYGIRSCGDSCPEISKNNISNNNTGIYCRESATPNISYNTISNNTGYGILIDNILENLVNPDIGGGEGGSDGKNNISGNYIHGVSNKTANSIMALNNWWGDAAGPKYLGNPNNATISSDWVCWSNINGIILFNPYSTEP